MKQIIDKRIPWSLLRSEKGFCVRLWNMMVGRCPMINQCLEATARRVHPAQQPRSNIFGTRDFEGKKRRRYMTATPQQRPHPTGRALLLRFAKCPNMMILLMLLLRADTRQLISPNSSLFGSLYCVCPVRVNARI